MTKQTKKEELLAEYLILCGIPIKDDNFIETPARIVRLHEEMMLGMSKEGEAEITKITSKTFPAKKNNMVVFSDIGLISLCPHHFLPVRMSCDVAYIPKGEKVIGLSKVPRLIQLLAKQPILQEDLTILIHEKLSKYISNDGVMVVLTGQHSCMCDRGVKTRAQVSNSEISGKFMNETTRNEALALMKKGEKKL